MTKSVIDALSRVSGIDKAEIRRIAESVTENNKKLNACYFHRFSITIGDGLRAKYKCTNCGGVVDGVRKKYYELGIEHGLKTSREG